MGNNSCTLVVHTEKIAYFSGEVVNGTVYLCVNDPTGIIARSVNLRCSGLERGIVYYTEEERIGTTRGSDASRSTSDINDRTTTRQIERYEEHEVQILNFDIPINTPLGSFFTQGQYEFPFNFVLPQNLPSSMFCKRGQSRCEVRYEMKAYLARSDRSSLVNAFNGNLISSKPLTLNIFGNNNSNGNLGLYHSNQPINFPDEIHQVRSCCCFGKGQMSLIASLANGLFIPNQSQSLSFALKNSSKAKVENVTIELIERVVWRPRYHEEVQESVLFQHVVDASSAHRRDWMSNEERDEQIGQYEYVPLSSTSESRMGSSGEQNVNVSTPHNARDSYAGKIIQVEHYVRVKVVTNGCCVSNPETTVDITVMRPMEAFHNDDNNDGTQFHSSSEPPPVPSAPVMDEEEDVVVEATVLPPDWSPLTCDVVTLPVADIVSVFDHCNHGLVEKS